jgi:hypothetical protein
VPKIRPSQVLLWKLWLPRVTCYEIGYAMDEWKWSGKDLRRQHDIVSVHYTVHLHRKAHCTAEERTDKSKRKPFNTRRVDLDYSRRFQKLRFPLQFPITACKAMFGPALHECYQECNKSLDHVRVQHSTGPSISVRQPAQGSQAAVPPGQIQQMSC